MYNGLAAALEIANNYVLVNIHAVIYVVALSVLGENKSIYRTGIMFRFMDATKNVYYTIEVCMYYNLLWLKI